MNKISDNKIYSKIENPFGWRRNLEYFKENFIIHMKELFEFKANIYSSLLIQVSFYILMFLFYFVIYSNFQSQINWKLSDFILFIAVSNLIHIFIGVVYWKWNLFQQISQGLLNRYLHIPLNPFFVFYIHSQSVMIYLFFVSNFLVFLISVIYFKINIFNLFFLLLLFLLVIETLVVAFFIDSLNFIKLGSSRIFQPLHENFMSITRNYPSPFFGSFQFNFLLFLFQGYYVGMVLIPILNGMSIFNFLFELTLLISIIIIFSLGTWLNWHYGLKKYEAFG